MMKKRTVYIITGFLLVVGLLMGAKSFRDEYLPIPMPPNPEWEPYLNTLDAQRESFFVDSNGTKLEADLFIPNGGQAKKPAVVFAVGSGDSLYQNYAFRFIETFLFEVFLPRDIAVLLVNKRAMGLSEGDYTKNSIEGRAEDIYAAVQHIKSHSQIDETKVGLVGHSQGGWVVTHAASKHPDIAFFISLAGPTTTMEENAVDNNYNYATCQDFNEEEIAAYLDKRERDRKLSIRIGELTNFGMFGFDARNMRYDPQAALKTIQIPGLFIYAEYDALVTPSLNINRMNEIFDHNVPEKFSVVTIDGATHKFRLVDDICDSFLSSTEFEQAEELVEVLNNWLAEQGY